MAGIACEPVLNEIKVNPQLFRAITDSVNNALGMCDTRVRCVGVSATPTKETGIITGMIGVHGKVSGFVSVNIAEEFVIRAVEGLLQEEFGKLCSQVIDGAGEITNIIVGGIKSALAKTEWGFSHITVPSVIVGQNFTIAYSRGLEFLTVTFEHDDADAIRLEDRMMHVSMSMLTL
ncbi:MAG: chemotaxis protein CheX [Planctomycetales bacterium]|nr:chemotaxis protein CheX [Planctomycetales bacterium]